MDTGKAQVNHCRRRRGWNFKVALFAAVLLAAPLGVHAQKATPRGPETQTGLITLSRNTSFDQALRVIQAFSGKVVVDPTHNTGPIGVDIDRQPWLLALVEIARENGLFVLERSGYYELQPVAAQAAEQVEAPPGLTADSREVIISAVFFQADRSVIRQLGIDWSTLSSGHVDVQAAQQTSSLVSGDALSLNLSTQIGKSVSVDALLKTFESRNVGEIVANPQVKVQNEKTGYIQVGSDFSVTTSDFAGNAITQFFSTGTILTVTPRIIADEEIEFVDLEVEAERSSLVDPVRNLISKTVARTTALLRDGEQTAIGGLYGQEVTKTRTGIPLLKDLPPWFFGLRYLFGHTGKEVRKTELVVLLKVDLVPSVRERIAMAVEEQTAGKLVRRKRLDFDEVLLQIQTEPAVTDSVP